MGDHEKQPMDGRVVRVVSFNCWGLKWVSKHREARIAAIAHKFAQDADKYDIVCLQEIWVENDFLIINDALKEELPYSKLFFSGILSGPGLAVFSRWPIVDASLHPFTLNGRPSAFFRGDWYVGKSVASVIVRQRPTNQLIQVLSAHMHAPYGPGDASYICHRTCQAWDMARLARNAVDAGRMVILVGDLNSIPGSPTYKLLQMVGKLNDSWVDRHGEFSEDIASIDAVTQIRRAGTTCDSLLNTYRLHCNARDAKRLDYIFYDASRAVVTDSRVSFTEQIDGIGSYSDHFAIESDFLLCENVESETAAAAASPNIGGTAGAMSESRSLYNEILAVIHQYRPTAMYKRVFHTWGFWLTVLIMIALLVSVWWAADDGRTYVAFIYIIIAWFMGLFMFVALLFSCFFGRMEMRALREYESQVRLAIECAN